MDEKLLRGELPIQSIIDKDDDCLATVPVHLDVLALPGEKRTSLSLIADAGTVVKKWYDEDMEFYLDALKRDNMKLPWLKGYERFKDDWQLGGNLDEFGFLRLFWGENGNTSNIISYCPIPVFLSNYQDEDGNFLTPDYVRQKLCTEQIGRHALEAEFLFMPPEKLKRYGMESDIAKIDLVKGIAEVTGHVFSSEYHDNMAKTLLLRDFAVFYLNRLLEQTQNCV